MIKKKTRVWLLATAMLGAVFLAEKKTKKKKDKKKSKKTKKKKN